MVTSESLHVQRVEDTARPDGPLGFYCDTLQGHQALAEHERGNQGHFMEQMDARQRWKETGQKPLTTA